jgi:hypothetical protein
MSLDPVADAIQNFDLRIALGIALCLLFFTLIVSLGRQVSRLQRELGQVWTT